MNLLKALSLTWILFSLASCGGGKQESTTTLKVTGGMSLSNTTFQGGMVIVGKSTTGLMFSVPMEYASGGTNEVTVTIPKGIWSFSAIGWSGATKMGNGALCAFRDNVDISEGSVDIQLTINLANCQGAEFGANGVVNSTVFDFHKIGLVTCNAFYQDLNTQTTISPAWFASTPTFCTTYPEDLQSQAKSYRISVPEITYQGNVTAGNFNRCINLDVGGLTNGSLTGIDIRLPLKRIPYQIDLFDDASCGGELINSHLFRNGFDETYPGFDHVYTASGTVSRVLISSKGTQKGYSPFLNLIPSFFLAVPVGPMPGSSNLLIKPNKEFLAIGDVLASGENCSSISFSGGSGGVLQNCRIEDNKMFLSISFDTSYCHANDCTVTIGSLPFIFRFDINNMVETYEDIFETIGFGVAAAPPTILPSISDFFHYSDSSARFGAYSEIRDMLYPVGPSGFLPHSLACASQNGSYAGTAWDDGILKGHTLTISNDNTPVPPFICESFPVQSCSGSPIFNKVMVLKRISGPTLITQKVMRFNCSNQYGMLETQDSETHTLGIKLKKEITYWNSFPGNNSRIERYRFTKDSDNSNTLKGISTSYERGEQIDSNKFIVKKLSFNSKLSSGSYRQRVNKSEHHNAGGGTPYIASYSTDLEKTSAAPSYIFSAPELAEEMESANFISDFNSTSPMFRSEARSSSGNYYIKANPEYDGTNYDFNLQIQSTAILNGTLNLNISSISGSKNKVIINENGKAVFTWYDSTNKLNLIHWDTTNGQWLYPNNGIVSMGTPVIASSQITTNSPSSSDIFFHGPNSDNFTIVWHEVDSSNHVIKARSYVSGTWGTSSTIVSSGMNPDPTTRAYVDIKVVQDSLGGFHLAALGNDGVDIEVHRLYCSSFSTLNCQPSLLTQGNYTAPGTTAKLHATKHSSPGEVQFNLRIVKPSTYDQIDTFISSSSSFTSDTSFASPSTNLHTMGRRCLQTASHLASANATGGTDCPYISEGNHPPIKNNFQYKLKFLEPSNTKFLSIFTPEATFQAQ